MAGETQFEIESLEEDLSDFNFTLFDRDLVVEKLNSLCRQFHLTSEKLFDEVIAYATNHKKGQVDVELLENFFVFYTKKTTKDDGTATKRRKVLVELTPSTVNKHDESMDTSVTQPNQVDSSKTYEDAPPYLASFAPVKCVAGPGWFCNRTDSGKVIVKLDGDRCGKGDKHSNKICVNIVCGQSPSSLSYGMAKAAKVIEGLSSRLEQYSNMVKEANETCANKSFDSLNTHSEGEVFVRGIVQSVNSRNSFTLVAEEGEGSASVEVDVSHLTEQCFLFPGQASTHSILVVLRGIARSSHLIEASSFLRSPTALPPLIKEASGSVSVWMCSGPFTSPSTASFEPLAHILHTVTTQQPNVLILTGPLVDRNNTFMTNGKSNLTDDQLTEILIKKITQAMSNCSTRVFIIPSSSRDSSVFPSFPSTTFISHKSSNLTTNVQLLSDPSILSVDGIEIAVTASEIIHHLSSAEVLSSKSKQGGDRIGRIAGHLLEQNCLYPLNPPLIAASPERLNEKCVLSHPPHILLTPCLLNPFIKSVNGCIVCNPGPICRGETPSSMLKMRVNLYGLPEEGVRSIEEYAQVHVEKL